MSQSRRSIPVIGAAVAAAALVALVAVGCGSTAAHSATQAPTRSTTTTTTTVPQTDAAGTVWLCRPGLSDDPCDGSMSTTEVTGTGHRSLHGDATKGNSRFDCFYVYPTASNESTINSDLTVQPAETSIAMAQAERFSKVCNVWAPMYNQITVSGLAVANSTDPGAYTVAYDSVLSAWNDFLANYDHGTPVIFIGHSQGSVMLIKLLEAQIDPDPTLRHLMVAAIIAGGNVTVPTGQTVGATFQNIPLCTALSESGCVIAYSSFPSEPPADANFGRPGQGISLNTGQTATTGVQVACVNPADIGGGTADLLTYWPLYPPLPIPSMAPSGPAVTTAWLFYPKQYSATCENADGASWLQVTEIGSNKDTRPVVNQIAGPSWGYHFQDINLALGNLVDDVQAEEVAYDAAS
jgi:CDGSH-type Zn-finger protein